MPNQARRRARGGVCDTRRSSSGAPARPAGGGGGGARARARARDHARSRCDGRPARRRVRRRAARYEREISEDYLASLAEGYARYFYHYNASPLLIVNSENLNFVERDADFELLVSRLRAMRSRREFFNLG